MAITVAMRTEVSQLYVALFGRAPDSEGLGFWVSQRNSGQSMTQIADAMFATAPARAYFPTWMTNQEIIGSFYSNVLGRTADAEGLAFWTGKLNAAGATPGSVITEMITAIANYNGTDPDGLASAALFNNKVEVAQYYAEKGGSIGNSTVVLADVTSDPATADAAIADIDAGTVGENPDTAQTIYLEVGQDVKSGGDANDTFNAFVVQNQLGQQVNTLGSGDVLAGGAGTDSLMAKVTAGAFAGSAGSILGSQTMPIQPMTTGIEIVKLEAVNSGIGIGGINIPNLPVLGELGLSIGETDVYINAKDMLGVNMIGSWHSDANLIIQNMTTQDNLGVGRELSEMTVVMGYTGNRDSHWSESDLSVYFDQDYLNPSIVRTRPSIDIRLMNEDAYDATINTADFRPLTGVYVAEMNFTLNGVEYDLDEIIDEDFNNGGTDIETYDELLAAIQSALVELKAAHPEDAALQTVTAEFGVDFLSDISPTTNMQRVGRSVTLSVDGTTGGVANTLEVGEDDLQILKANNTPDEIGNSNRYERAEATPSEQEQQLRINVELEKVGLAGDGGQLIVGSMFKDGQNVWSDLYDGKGIDIFDVTVSGAADKPSSLAGLHSTGNNLREVYVDTNATQTGTFADLTIGNSNTPFLNLPQSMELGDVVTPSAANQMALKDVRIFDAAGLKGDLTLYAALTGEVTEKYMTLVDEAQDQPALDNVEFVYTGGTGNDYINLWLSDENLAKAGTTTREDFELTINGGAGNDEIVVMIGEDSAGFGEDISLDENLVDSIWEHWYQNSAINANLNINGDAGNDTIRTLGSGNWVIDGGSGDDTIYADNTGGEDGNNAGGYFNDGKATWVFNSVNNDVDDLLSHNAASVQAVNAQLTVHFMGYSKTVTIADSVGKTANVTITDLHINQAIKLAINSDPVLSKLLVAEDGPARTLIVRSLIDGEMGDGWADYGDNLDNLSIRFSSTPLVAPGQTGLALFTTAATNGGTLLDGYNPTTDATFGWDDNATLEGEDSDNVADNDIEGGTGNDVIVLGTGHWSNDTLVYNGLGNGTDSIVNFQDNVTMGWNSSDYETVSLAFTASDGDPVAQTIVFDGVTVNLAAPTLQGIIPPLDVASQFVNQYNAAAATNGWVASLGVAVPGSPGVAGVSETADMTAVEADADLTAGQTYTVAGLTYTSTGVTTQAQLAAAFASLADGATSNPAGLLTGSYSGALTGYTTSAVAIPVAGTNVVTFTSTIAGNVADLTDSGTGAAAATIAVTTQGVAAVPAVAATHTVLLTHDTPGAVTDLTAASFTGTYFATNADPDGQGVVTVTVTNDAADNVVAGTASTFTVTYDTATTAVTAAGDVAITNPASAVQGDGALTLATKLAAAGVVGFTNGGVVAGPNGTSYSVTFTAPATGPTAIPLDTTFGLGATATDGVNGTFTSTLGVADTTTPPVFTLVEEDNWDFIDFTSYDVTGVVVTDSNQAGVILGSEANGIVGAANGANGTKWITMTEVAGAGNDGVYTISLVTAAGAAGSAGDIVDLIGVADFGYEKDFTDYTFFL